MKRAVIAAYILWVSVASADTITIAGKTYSDVYVMQTARAYYVCLPDDGQTISVVKTDPSVSGVTIDKNKRHRAARYAEFKARRTIREREAVAANAESAPLPPADFTFEMGSRPEPQPAAANTVPVLRLKGEPRGAPPELQAIIDANLNGSQSYAAGTGGGAGGGSGGSTGAAMGGGGAGAGGAGGSAAGGGQARGGGGQNGAGGQGGSFGFRNISDLFTTVDDADVGETPNSITGR